MGDLSNGICRTLCRIAQEIRTTGMQFAKIVGKKFMSVLGRRNVTRRMRNICITIDSIEIWYYRSRDLLVRKKETQKSKSKLERNERMDAKLSR
jgi:hypothetical protein